MSKWEFPDERQSPPADGLYVPDAEAHPSSEDFARADAAVGAIAVGENMDTSAEVELYRPRIIEADPSRLKPVVALMGTCGSPESTWRSEIFIPKLTNRNLAYFNPQLPAGTWTPEMAKIESENMATDEVLVFPISAESHGYASMAETGLAMLSALLRGQKLGIFVEKTEEMSAQDLHVRNIFMDFADRLHKDYPVFHYESSMEDLADWAAIISQERQSARGSKISERRTVELPATDARQMVAVFGTSSKDGAWKQSMRDAFEAAKIDYFDSYRGDWQAERDLPVEFEHKVGDEVLLQYITGETESLGSLAEVGLLALSAFIRGKAYGIYLEDHPSDRKSDTNRARSLVRAHIAKLNEQFPNLIYVAESADSLTDFGVRAMNSARRNASEA